MKTTGSSDVKYLAGLLMTGIAVIAAWSCYDRPASTSPTLRRPSPAYEPRQEYLDTSGVPSIVSSIQPWGAEASLEDVGNIWRRIGYRLIDQVDRELADPKATDQERVAGRMKKAVLYNFEGEPKQAYRVLERLRLQLSHHNSWAQKGLYTVIFYQGVTALRQGENENCILCRGESSCILPISSAAVHKNPEGSRLAIRHFTEYLARFPDDLAVQWLLNLAHMTLGEYPGGVDPQFLISLDHFQREELDIGAFRDIGHVVGLNRFNQAGGGIMEDFDNDGLLDIVVTTMDPTGPMGFYRNDGKGRFQNCSDTAGLEGQLGGLYCVQTDYDNDGYKDVLIVRGAWLRSPIRPTLLRNNHDGTFTDVTVEAG
ncbi:MAG TPA: VCBS repeat-containing protein, partial [Planctomycetaceae bacterium]|nr:VCBS repeat-containing protein [Planctomycetaceae bacterium]